VSNERVTLWLLVGLLAGLAGYFVSTGLLPTAGGRPAPGRAVRPPAAARRALAAAGLADYPSGWVALALVGIGALSAVAAYYLARDAPVLTAAGAVGGPLLAWLLLCRHHRRLRAERHDALIDAADLVARALDAELNVQQAIELLRTDGPPALQPEFGRVIRAVGHGGLTWSAALWRLRRRLDDRFGDDVVDLLIQGVVDGPAGVGPGLTSLVAQELAADGLRREIVADQASVHTAVLMVTGMMLALFVALRWLNPDYLRPYDTPEGQAVLAGGGLAVAAIYLMMRRLGRVDDDPLAAAEEWEPAEGER
jgi:Flp pilus assembly protein TadB